MKKTLERVLCGTLDKNIDFSDLRKLIISFGFSERVKGDHFIYSKPGIVEIINIQPVTGGKAKPYQVKQVRNLIIRYKLNKEK